MSSSSFYYEMGTELNTNIIKEVKLVLMEYLFFYADLLPYLSSHE